MRKFLLLLVGVAIAFANPAPFGFELGKATYSEVIAKYPAKKSGINEHSQGKIIAVDKSNFDLNTLAGDVSFIFDANEKLIYVELIFSKSKFDDILSSLSKYKVVKKTIPFVGNKFAEFKDGDCKIMLNAPHLSFQMELIYVMNDFYEKVQNSNKEKEQNRKLKQDSML